MPDNDDSINGGWIKLYRKIYDSAVFADPNLLKVWIWCLTQAAHKTQHVAMKTGRGSSVVTVEPGQLIYGRATAAKALKMRPSSVDDRVKRLANMQNLDRHPNTHWTILTVCNWGVYNSSPADTQQEARQPTDNQPTTNRHIQDVKDVKEVRTGVCVPYEAIKDYWNGKARLGKHQHVRIVTKQRREKLQQRWREQAFREEWQAAIDNLEAERFWSVEYKGALFDYFVRNDTNYVKALERPATPPQERRYA